MEPKRIHEIDFVRGLVMIIMALDHVRDFVHVDALTQNPTDLATTTPALFFTRWITHLCAPTFVFLAGTSAYLAFKKEGNISNSRRFLIKRGLALLLMEFTVVNLALWFDLGFHNIIFQVIGAIGFGFILLGFMLKLPVKTIGLIGLTIICCHSLVAFIPLAEGSVVKTILTPFFGPTAFPLSAHTFFIMGYPPIPWFGIMLVGFALGPVFERSTEERTRLFLQLGLGALLSFVVLRFTNLYGDPVVWTTQKDTVYTILSFLNVSKYPPSLLFCLLMLGIMFLLLANVGRVRSRVAQVVTMYGKVPLFYFLIHFYLIHSIAVVMLFLQGFHWSDMEFASGNFGRPKGVESGVELWVVYLIWVAVVAVLYPVCRWYGAYKAGHKAYWWLRYL